MVGIFVALQASNWNETRKDRIDEQKFLSRLPGHINLQATGLVDPPSKCPELFRLQPHFDSGDGEVVLLSRCELDQMRKYQPFLNNLSESIDRYDAYVQDGLAPWIQQVDKVHSLVDESLGIDHDSSATAEPASQE